MIKKLLTGLLIGTLVLGSVGVSAATKDEFTGWWYEKSTSSWTYKIEGVKAHDGIIQENGKMYYFDSLGNMATGWIQYGSQYMYADNSGSIIHSDWRLVNNKWYYFANAGVMLTGTITLSDGKTYNLASDGHLIG